MKLKGCCDRNCPYYAALEIMNDMEIIKKLIRFKVQQEVKSKFKLARTYYCALIKWIVKVSYEVCMLC